MGSHLPQYKGALLKRVRGEVHRLLTRQGLIEVKARALRRRVWFKVTSRLERGIVDLAIRCVERIRSPVLTRIISEIIRKVLDTVERGFVKRAEKIGAKVAERICGIATAWGNKTARSWKHDYGFVRFLGVNAVNAQVNRV